MRYKIDFDQLGIKLKSKRKKGKFSLREVSEFIGLSPSTLSRIERRQFTDISISSFLAVCSFLEIAPTEFIKGDFSSSQKLTLSLPEQIDILIFSSDEIDRSKASFISAMVRAAIYN